MAPHAELTLATYETEAYPWYHPVAVLGPSYPIFLHLNSFCGLEVWGHRRLVPSFSPFPGTLIEVLPAD